MKVIDKPKQVLKIKDVASFNFEFVAGDRLVMMKDVEGILMSPKWAPHRYDTTLKQLIAIKTDEPDIITIDEFKKLKIPDTVMRDGILFIWVEKELIHEIIKFFGDQKFEYIENLCHVILDPTQEASTKQMNNTDATPAIHREKYPFLNKSHRTLLMLRRNLGSGQPLELRHQRTGDVVFDWVDPTNRFKTPQYYAYKLIETLLPKANPTDKQA